MPDALEDANTLCDALIRELSGANGGNLRDLVKQLSQLGDRIVDGATAFLDALAADRSGRGYEKTSPAARARLASLVEQIDRMWHTPEGRRSAFAHALLRLDFAVKQPDGAVRG